MGILGVGSGKLYSRENSPTVMLINGVGDVKLLTHFLHNKVYNMLLMIGYGMGFVKRF